MGEARERVQGPVPGDFLHPMCFRRLGCSIIFGEEFGKRGPALCYYLHIQCTLPGVLTHCKTVSLDSRKSTQVIKKEINVHNSVENRDLLIY